MAEPIKLHISGQNFQEFRDSLDDFAKNQLPFAVSKALTQSAVDARNYTRDQMRNIFDRPRSFTLNSMLISSATKTKLEARVYYDMWASKGTPAGEYLSPNAFGTTRPAKRSEQLLRSRGVLKSNEFIIPSAAAPQDKYGNVRTSEIIKILSALQAAFDTTTWSKKKGRVKSGAEYFVSYSLSGTRRINAQTKKGKAIYRKTSSGVQPMFFVTDQPPQYEAIFNFEELVSSRFRAVINSNFNAAFAYAMSTAKLKK